MNANCSLCGCYNEAVPLPNGKPICKDEARCARRIRQDLIYYELNPFAQHWRGGFGKAIGFRFKQEVAK